MLEILNAHQIPLSPITEDNNTATGMRAEVKVTLTIDGYSVRPRPENAPIEVYSTIINIWLSPTIRR